MTSTNPKPRPKSRPCHPFSQEPSAQWQGSQSSPVAAVAPCPKPMETCWRPRAPLQLSSPEPQNGEPRQSEQLPNDLKTFWKHQLRDTMRQCDMLGSPQLALLVVWLAHVRWEALPALQLLPSQLRGAFTLTEQLHQQKASSSPVDYSQALSNILLVCFRERGKRSHWWSQLTGITLTTGVSVQACCKQCSSGLEPLAAKIW